jgi:hypothetical protein
MSSEIVNIAQPPPPASDAWIVRQPGMPWVSLLSPQHPSNRRNLESAKWGLLMQSVLRVMFAALMMAAVAYLPTAAKAQESVKQIKLTEKQVQGFIAAQKEMQPIMEKIQGATSDQLDPKLQAALEAAAKKNGFKDMAEYDDVAANISMVMAGIDPQTKVFTEPQAAIKKEIAEVTADKSMSEQEKKQVLEELNEALKWAQPIQFPSNIELVKKYYDKIDAGLT